MSFFSSLVKVVVETVKLPVAVVKDVGTLGEGDQSHTGKQLDKIKEASEG